MLLLTKSSPDVSPMVPVTAKVIVSPSLAIASALRSEPGPLSLVFVTVMIVALARECDCAKECCGNCRRLPGGIDFGPHSILGLIIAYFDFGDGARRVTQRCATSRHCLWFADFFWR